MVKVIDLKRFWYVVFIAILLVIELLVNKFVFSNRELLDLCFKYSKQLIIFNTPFLASKTDISNLIKIENLMRFSHPLFASFNRTQTFEEQSFYEDDAIVINYDQERQDNSKASEENQADDNIEFQKYLKNIRPNGSISYNIEVMNQTEYRIDITKFLNTKFKIYGKVKPSILIYHTHTTESYENPSKNLIYTRGTTDRTLDFNYNVVRVGEELKRILEKDYGYKVYHSKDINDYPEYKGSYARSLKIIERYKKEHPDIKIFIDLHRDAIGDGSKKIKVSTVAFGQELAKVMLVVGTDKLGLYHPFWRENLTFAVHLQKNLMKVCPQITRPINISAARYNQHISPYALIIEIGSNGNLLNEALKSCQIVAKALDDTIMGR
ncbi:stage II sporulation protein P [Caldicellulosiruptor sp. DIB 104C]|uniref:stage II sporulation protein P n=1 Tax=Caldicellulosiruptor sp. DIB 104C TaxID=3019889 RepID=UPI002305A3EF|nr:stage II sporulation protein P [Caldicellulosiruptor sp. DIB 104C]